MGFGSGDRSSEWWAYGGGVLDLAASSVCEGRWTAGADLVPCDTGGPPLLPFSDVDELPRTRPRSWSRAFEERRLEGAGEEDVPNPEVRRGCSVKEADCWLAEAARRRPGQSDICVHEDTRMSQTGRLAILGARSEAAKSVDRGR